MRVTDVNEEDMWLFFTKHCVERSIQIRSSHKVSVNLPMIKSFHVNRNSHRTGTSHRFFPNRKRVSLCCHLIRFKKRWNIMSFWRSNQTGMYLFISLSCQKVYEQDLFWISVLSVVKVSLTTNWIPHEPR